MKKISKTKRVLLIILVVIVATMGILYGIFKSSTVQSYLTKKIINYISSTYNINLNIEGLDIALFKKVILEKILLKDLNSDTLFYSDRFVLDIDRIFYGKHIINLSNIEINDMVFNILGDTTSTNLGKLISSLSSDSTATPPPDKEKGKPWDLNLKGLNINNSRFVYSIRQEPGDSGVIQFSNIHLRDINIDLEDININDSLISCQIVYIQFKEKSGFNLEYLTSKQFTLSGNHFSFTPLTIKTPLTEIYASTLAFRHDGVDDFDYFEDKVKIYGEIQYPTRVNVMDIGHFTSSLPLIDQPSTVGGTFDGTVNDFEITDLNFHTMGNTLAKANVKIKNAALDNVYIDLLMSDVTSVKDEIEKIYYIVMNKEVLELPDFFNNAKQITVSGRLKGDANNLSFNGLINNSLGRIKSNVSMVYNPSENYDNLKGTVEVFDFNIGSLTNTTDYLNQVSLTTEVDGKLLQGNKFSGNIKSFISKIDFYNHSYSNIQFDGQYIDDKAGYFLKINDPVLKINSIGTIDFSAQLPVFYFNNQLYHANLYQMHLDSSNVNSSLKLNLIVKGKGNNLDNIVGDCELYGGIYKVGDNQMSLDKFILSIADPQEGSPERRFNLKSDYIDGYISGQYVFNDLIQSLKYYGSGMVPSVFGHRGTDIVKPNGKNSIEFSFNIKDIKEITNIFAPDISLTTGLRLSGFIKDENATAGINLYSRHLSIADNIIDDLKLDIEHVDDKLVLKTNLSNLKISESEAWDTLYVNSTISHDTIDFKLDWVNKNRMTNFTSEFSFLCVLSPNINKIMPLINIEIKPGQIYLIDKVWNISSSEINIDTTSIQFNNFKISNEKQYINLVGTISEDPSEALFAVIDKLDLDNFDLLLENEGVNLDGILYGKTWFKDLYHVPQITSYDSISGLQYNGYKLGKLSLVSQWDEASENIQMDIGIDKGKFNTFSMKGNVNPSSGNIDFKFHFEKFMIDVFNDFAEGFASKIRGMASTDSLFLMGSLKNPELIGAIKLQKAGFNIDYLQTDCSFTDYIYFKPGAIFFNNIEVFDSKRNKAKLNGKIKHKGFGDFVLDLSLDANNFLFLNTTPADNEYFYGKTFATGLVNISGPTDNLVIEVTAHTDKNTQFFIPLTSSSEVVERDFITFVRTNEEATKESLQKADNDNSNLTMEFNLEVTPDAEVQLIFDETVGDIIKGSGAGNLKLEIDTKGKFTMQGTLEIYKGEYLFTIKNVMNKRLNIEPGGFINWSGDPYDADVNLNAVYNLKRVPLFDLTRNPAHSDVKVPVDCNIKMEKKLMSPDITFGVKVLDDQYEDTKQLENLTQEEINSQFVWLLIMNKFKPLYDQGNSNTESAALGSNVSEVITNQVSNLLSKISDDVEVGVNASLSDTISNSEIEVALSTQLLNDRVIINGNVSMGGQQTNNSNFVGEFDIEYKITKSGQFRLKYFTKADENVYDASVYRQGVGIFYRKEFNNFKDLFKRKNKNNSKSKNIKQNNEATKEEEEIKPNK